MFRRVIAGLAVAGLAIGVWLVWPEGDVEMSPSTSSPSASPTTDAPGDTSASATTTVPTTSTTVDTHVVETVEEAEAILRELWFGWFEGIYNQDEDRIREVVATEEFLDAGLTAFDSLSFTNEPTSSGISIVTIEILRSDAECLAVWTESNVSFLEAGPNRTGVDIIRRTDDGKWKLASAWANRNDLWENDCEALLQPLP